MSAATQRARSQAMAAELIRRGYPLGKRHGSPSRNSGGLANAGPGAVGSAAHQRRTGQTPRKER